MGRSVGLAAAAFGSHVLSLFAVSPRLRAFEGDRSHKSDPKLSKVPMHGILMKDVSTVTVAAKPRITWQTPCYHTAA